MIDTDKYEGHKEGLWVYEEKNTDPNYNNVWEATVLIPHAVADGKPYPVLSASGQDYHLNRADLKLIADAPILLEEVKDLQKKLDNLREYCHAEGYDIFNWEVKNIEVIE